jgi:hypothetical protein
VPLSARPIEIAIILSAVFILLPFLVYSGITGFASVNETSNDSDDSLPLTNLTENIAQDIAQEIFNVTDQNLSVSISLLSPEDSSVVPDEVVFEYELSSISGVERCSIYLMYRYIEHRFNLVQTNSSPQEGLNTFKVSGIQPGEHLWRVGCSNSIEEVFSDSWVFISGEDLGDISGVNFTSNLSELKINISNITEIPSELVQGSARIETPVNWTMRMLVNQTGDVVVTAYLPKDSSGVEIYETQVVEPAKGVMGVAAGPRKVPVNPAKVSFSEPVFLTIEGDRAVVQRLEMPSAMSVYSAFSPRQKMGFISRFMSWLSSLFGITGLQVSEPHPVELLSPENGAVVGRNINLLFQTDKEYDECALYLDSALNQTDIIVLEGLNFFDVRGLAPGNHTWQVVCALGDYREYSSTLSFISGEDLNVSDLESVNVSNATVAGILYSLPEGSGEFFSVDITDNLAVPVIYEISYQTPGPSKYEQVKGEFIKGVTILSNISFSNVTAYSELPWVPAWMVKLYEVSGEERTRVNTTLIDRDDDGLIDDAEWLVPHLSARVYEFDLSYEITGLGMAAASKIGADGSSEDVSALLAEEDGNVTTVDRGSMIVSFSQNISDNDTISLFAWSSEHGTIELFDNRTGNILSSLSIRKDEWFGYNLTVNGLGEVSDSIGIRSGSLLVIDQVSAYDKQVIIPKKVSSLASNTSAVLEDNASVDLAVTRQFDSGRVLLRDGSGSPLSSFDVYFENSPLDIDLSIVAAKTDLEEKKSIIHLGQESELISVDKALYIPYSGEDLVYICPRAKSLSEVTEGCPGWFYVYPGENEVNVTEIMDPETNATSVSARIITMSIVDVDGSVFYRVDGLTGTGGGEALRIINVKSHPRPKGNWTILFTAEGEGNLTITPVLNTTFSEFLSDNPVTEDDIRFAELYCGSASLTPNLKLVDSEGIMYDYSSLTEADSVAITSIFIENYSCSTTGSLVVTEITGGHHFIRFDFGDQYAIAENYVSNLSCEVTTSCLYTDVFHIESLFNSHAELANQSNYANKVCCREIYGEPVNTECGMSGSETVLRLESQTNSQVAKSSESSYPFEVCLRGTVNYNISCDYASSCAAYDTCVASISSTESGADSNLHIGDCTTLPYTTRICCGSQETSTCITPYDGYAAMQDVTICPGTYYINDSGANGLLRFGTDNITVTCNSTKIIGNNTGFGFYAAGRSNITLIGCTIANYTDGILINNTAISTFRNNSLFNNTYGMYLLNSTGNKVYYSNFTSSSSYHAVSTLAGNHFNTTSGGNAQGNYWDDVLSLEIYDTNADGYGDYGSQYPYNSTYSSKVTANVTDWGPMTTKAMAPGVTQFDPLQNWVLNDTIKFECNASSSIALVNASLFHNASGTWTRASYKSISGTYSEFEFNISGFTDGQRFNWTCEACTASACGNSSSRNITIDLTRPQINYTTPTPATNNRNTTFYNWLYANVSTTDSSNMSALLDFNRSLVGWWRFENNTNDSSSYASHASCTTCPEVWTGARGKAYRFNNSGTFAGNYLSIPIRYYGTEHTIMLWAKWASGNSGMLIGHDGDEYGLYYAGGSFWYATTAGTNLATYTPDTAWHHYAVVRSGTSVQLYIDGAPQGVKTHGNNNELRLQNIGSYNNGWETWNGTIDEVMIFNRSVSSDEVNASYQNQAKALFRNFTGLPSGMVNYTAAVVDMAGNYNTTGYRNYSVNYVPALSAITINSSSGTNYTNENLTINYSTSDSDSDTVKNITNWYVNGTSIAVLNMPFESNAQLNMSAWTKDYSPRNNHGTVSGATWNATGGYDGRGAYVFDGNDDYINIIAANADKTVAAWVKPYSYRESYMAVIGGYYLQLVNSGNIARFNGTAYSYSTVTVPQNGWSYIAITCDSGTNQLKFYINGSLSNTVTSICTTSGVANSIGAYTQGCITPGCYRFNGSIDEVMIINRTLTADQILLLYQNSTDKIHHLETRVGQNWSACVTPNDGYEDGMHVCSVNLTVTGCEDEDGDGFGGFLSDNLSLCTHPYIYDCDDSNASILPPYDDLNITSNTWLCNGIYYLNTSASNGIVNFKASGINLTCNNTRIIGNNTGSAFYSSGLTGISLVGCNASNYTYGMYLDNTNSSTIRNNSIFNASYGLYLSGSTNDSVYYNSFWNSSLYHAYSTIAGNKFNTTNGSSCGSLCARGNYWSGIELLKIYDTNSDGYGDAGLAYPYNSTNGGNVSTNVNDYGPLTTRTDYRIQPPIPFQPASEAIITDSRNPEYGWNNPEHTLSDSVTYQVQVDNNSDFGSPEVNAAGISETAISSYYWSSSSLGFFTTHYWRVRANDTYNVSEWSVVRNFSIMPTTSCTQPVSEVDFGQMCIFDDQAACDAAGKGSHINDTLDNHPPPYVIMNDGNLKSRGKVYSTKLWESPSIPPIPNKYYQYRIGINESGAYDWALDSAWYNMTNTSGSALEAYYGFKWENVSDALNVHIRLESPTDEPPGVKYSTTYVTVEQNESYY